MSRGQAVYDRIERRLTEYSREMARDVEAAEYAMARQLNSGAMIRRRLELIKQYMIKGTDWSLSEIEDYCRRSRVARPDQKGFLDQALLRYLYQVVDASKVQSAQNPEFITRLLQTEIEAIRSMLGADLEEYQRGVWKPRLAPVQAPAVQHVVNVGGDLLGAVQQGEGNVQHTSIVINRQEVAEIVSRLESAVADLPEHLRNELQPDLDTIRAQLQKPAPNNVILGEASKSLRNISEGMVAGAVMSAPAVLHWVQALASAIGLG